MSKLALGSANFGLNYGLANRVGKISDTELCKILSLSDCMGIDVIDTAEAYGDSEDRLGTFCSDISFKFITKIGVDVNTNYFENQLSNLIEQSRQRLKQSKLYAVLLHRPEILLGDHGGEIIKELSALKDQNIISKIGVSIYSPEILHDLRKVLSLDIVQVPYNIFDQQITTTGWSEKLKESGTEIHARSVFLQGLLLMHNSNLPPYFTKRWPDLFNSWYKFLLDHKVDALDVALNFVLKQAWIDKVVVGVDSMSQLRTLLGIETSSALSDFPELGSNDKNLINPSNWELK